MSKVVIIGGGAAGMAAAIGAAECGCLMNRCRIPADGSGGRLRIISSVTR